MLQETEQQRDQEAQKLATLSSRVMNAAGMTDRGTETDPATALEAIEKMKHHLKSTLQELEDVKLKVYRQLYEPHYLITLPTQFRNSVLVDSDRIFLPSNGQLLTTVCLDWQTRISEERQRLNELRTAHSPLRGMDAQSVTPR